nr:hypothetical protein [Tanacetum cinerariifolium]
MSNTNNTMKTQTSNTLYNDIMEAGGKDRRPMLAPGNYVQWKYRIKRYIDTKPNHELIHYCLKNPPYKYTWADKAVLVSKGSSKTTTERCMETYKNVSQDIRDQLNAEAKAIQIILTWIDNDIYSTVDACPNACEMWKAIEMLKQVYHPQNHTIHYTQISSTRSQQAATRNRGKVIVNSPPPIYDQEPSMVAEDDEIGTGYDNQRIGNVVGARETKPKREKDAAYHKEKMLLCKQEEAGFQLNTEQADWRDDIDDKPKDQELKAHYMYMAQIQEVTPDAVGNSGPIFDTEPLQKVPNNDHYNVFAIESEHPEQSKSIHDTYLIEQDEHNMIIDSLDMSYDREQIDLDDDDLSNERDLLASLIDKLKCEIDDSKNRNKFLETSKKIKFHKTREDKELVKVIALENKVKVLDNIVYKTSQTVQTMNMLNRNCKISSAKPEFLKKAQRANPRLYDIGCYNDNLALMLAPESDEVIRLEKKVDQN